MGLICTILFFTRPYLVNYIEIFISAGLLMLPSSLNINFSHIRAFLPTFLQGFLRHSSKGRITTVIMTIPPLTSSGNSLLKDELPLKDHANFTLNSIGKCIPSSSPLVPEKYIGAVLIFYDYGPEDKLRYYTICRDPRLLIWHDVSLKYKVSAFLNRGVLKEMPNIDATNLNGYFALNNQEAMNCILVNNVKNNHKNCYISFPHLSLVISSLDPENRPHPTNKLLETSIPFADPFKKDIEKIPVRPTTFIKMVPAPAPNNTGYTLEAKKINNVFSPGMSLFDKNYELWSNQKSNYKAMGLQQTHPKSKLANEIVFVSEEVKAGPVTREIEDRKRKRSETMPLSINGMDLPYEVNNINGHLIVERVKEVSLEKPSDIFLPPNKKRLLTEKPDNNLISTVRRMSITLVTLEKFKAKISISNLLGILKMAIANFFTLTNFYITSLLVLAGYIIRMLAIFIFDLNMLVFSHYFSVCVPTATIIFIVRSFILQMIEEKPYLQCRTNQTLYYISILMFSFITLIIITNLKCFPLF